MSNTTSDIFQRHRLTVAEYHRMAETGIFSPDARVELIEGEVIDMPPIGSLHAGTVDYIANALRLAYGGQVIVRTQNPIRLSQHSEPQPDIALLRPRPDFYRNAHPTPVDVFLTIEVADTTLAYDTQIKLPLYARHGTPSISPDCFESSCIRTQFPLLSTIFFNSANNPNASIGVVWSGSIRDSLSRMASGLL